MNLICDWVNTTCGLTLNREYCRLVHESVPTNKSIFLYRDSDMTWDEAEIADDKLFDKSFEGIADSKRRTMA